MTWIQIYIASGVVFSILLIYFMGKEFIKIAREKDDYNGSVNLPD